MRTDQAIAACILTGMLAAPAAAQLTEKEKRQALGYDIARAIVPALAQLAVQDKQPPKPAKARTAGNVVIQRGSASYLGVGVVDIDAERAKALKLSEERGVEVRNIDGDSPAAKAGLKEGDVVLEFNGQRVESGEQFARLVREMPAGRQVKLLISREGKTQTLTAAIGTRTAQFVTTGPDGFRFSLPAPPAPPAPPASPRWSGKWWGGEFDMPSPSMSWRSGTLGIETEGLSSQLAQFFGVKEGVLVRSVNKNSPAEKAGIKAGDVIVKVNENSVDSPDDVSRHIRTGRDKGRVNLTLMREKKEMTVTVDIGDDSERGIAFAATFC
jgi:serine protease Do